MRQRSRVGVRPALAAALAAGLVAVAVVLLLSGGRATSATSGSHPVPTAVPGYGPAPLATYDERAPHVTSSLNTYGVQGGVQGAPSTPPDALPPVAPAAFKAPVAAYLAYSGRRLGLMEAQITALKGALAAGDRSAAKNAWRRAYADYLGLGGVYLEGRVAALNQAIDGMPDDLRDGVDSPRFSGLHRLERGLWRGASLASLASLRPWADRLASDVARLRRMMPRVQIAPLDYATRAHEVLEDAVRDLLSGAAVPWSREGVLGTIAALAATNEIVHTLAPLLGIREGVLPVVRQDLRALQSTLASIEAAHGGRVPTNSELSQTQAERLDASLGQTLESLAQIPGALETTQATPAHRIPRSAFERDS